jgi:hypothetical protein
MGFGNLITLREEEKAAAEKAAEKSPKPFSVLLKMISDFTLEFQLHVEIRLIRQIPSHF